MRLRLSAGGAAALAVLSVLCLAAPGRAQDHSDIVPRGDIAYDLLGSLAAQGRLPGYTLRDFARGDRLYTRDEIARMLASELPDTMVDRLAVSQRILRERFAPELFHADPSLFTLDPSVPAHSAELGGWAKARGLTDPSAGGVIGRFSAALPFGRDGYAVIGGGNWRDEWQGRHSLTPPGHYDFLENAYIHVNGRALDVTVGRAPVRWGNGYSGALLVGDQAPSIPQIAVDKSFLLPGALGRHIGRLNFNEFLGEFWEANNPNAQPDAQGTRRELIGRRLVARGGPWSFSIAEAMKSTHLPDPIWAAILPLYLYQNDWTANRKKHYLPFLATRREPDTFWKNYQADAGMSYQADPRTGLLLYTELLIDDIKSPKGVGNGFKTPQKLGEQYGVYLPRIGGASHYGARIEYTTINPGTYTNDSAPVAWTQNGASLAYPTGPNSRVLFGRLDAALTDRTRLSLEGATRREYGAPFPGYAVARDDRLGAYASYSLSRNAFLGARLDHVHDEIAHTHVTRLEANATVGF
jgi:hypothetical protein